ncbi:ATP synthase [Aspergillus venezuelensis]
MSSLRFARSALRARPAAFRVPVQRRGYAEAVNDKIKLSLVLPHQVRFRPAGLPVNIPAESGEMGVLANHVPSIEQLKPGLVEIVEEGGANKKFFLSGGFAVVQPDSQLSINAVEGFPLEDFSADNVRAQIAEAQKIAGGNGSEQDIAEAKIELEAFRSLGSYHNFTYHLVMAEELPIHLPISFSHELGFLDQDEFYGSQLFETPRKWHTKLAPPAQHGSVSPASMPNRPRTIDRLSGDEDYKDLLSTFPRLFSDLTTERDPFFDHRGIPLNPHNTPISQSGRQSETGSCEKDKRNAPLAAKHVKQALGRSSDADDSFANPLTSVSNSGRPTWKPPKPPKPSHLSDIDLSPQRETENVRQLPRLQLPKRGDSRRALPETFYRSLPSRRTSRNISQPFGRSTSGQAAESEPVISKRSWQTRSIVPCRYFPRPFTEQELKVLGIPLNNPDMPFPAPIPTMDKLPLRRGIIKCDWQQEDQDSVNSGRSSTTTKYQPSKLRNSVWRFFRNVLTPAQLRKDDSGYPVSRKEEVRAKREPTTRTTITIPFTSRCETRPEGQTENTITSLIGGAYVLQVDLSFPTLLAHRTILLAAVIQRCMSSRIAVTAASVLRAIIDALIRWLLSVFHIDVAVEIRQL